MGEGPSGSDTASERDNLDRGTNADDSSTYGGDMDAGLANERDNLDRASNTEADDGFGGYSSERGGYESTSALDNAVGWIKSILGAANAMSSPVSAGLWAVKQFYNLQQKYGGTMYDPSMYEDWTSALDQPANKDSDPNAFDKQQQQQQAAEQRQSDWLDYLDTFRKLAGGNVAPSSLLDTDNKDTDIYG